MFSLHKIVNFISYWAQKKWQQCQNIMIMEDNHEKFIKSGVNISHPQFWKEKGVILITVFKTLFLAIHGHSDSLVI